MVKYNITQKNFVLSLFFGLVMGLIFPVFAGFFVEYKSDSGKIIFIFIDDRSQNV